MINSAAANDENMIVDLLFFYREFWMFWMNLKVLYRNGEDKKQLMFIQKGMDCTRMPCGIAAVESSFSPLKIIHTAKRAALGYKKTDI